MQIILFRHGEHVGDKLTKEGRQTVKNIGTQLKDFNVSKIYTSSANRCRQTCEILSKILSVDNIEIKDDLRERFQLHHTPKTVAEKRWWDNYMNINYKEPQKNRVGETLKEFFLRNYKIFDEIVSENKKEDAVLIVAHSATSYALTSYIYKANNPIWMKLGNANYIVFEID